MSQRDAPDNFSSFRPAKDEQMRALQRMLTTSRRQSEDLPKTAAKSLEPPPRTSEED